MTTTPTTFSTEKQGILLSTLKARFEKNMNRHLVLEWSKVNARLIANPAKLWTLAEMERTGGEPDVVTLDNTTGECVFCDCSPETPEGRRNVCYDQAALEARKKFPPADSAKNMAVEMGIELLTEAQYHELQQFGHFDTKTSSWIETPPEVRKLGGALFADYRYGRVFIYHNGADSYYGVRGFRGLLKV
jgi:hypothetical protein